MTIAMAVVMVAQLVFFGGVSWHFGHRLGFRRGRLSAWEELRRDLPAMGEAARKGWGPEVFERDPGQFDCKHCGMMGAGHHYEFMFCPPRRASPGEGDATP